MTFLATTALAEFWEPAEETLFLGTWCLRCSRRAEWANLRYRVLPCPWNDRKRFNEAAQHVDDVSERLLDHFVSWLNEVHGVSHSLRYWRILIGPWLLHHVHQMYDRYVHLRDAFDAVANLRTVVLDPAAFRTPRDANALAALGEDDLWNLQMVSQILAGLGHVHPVRAPRVAPADPVGVIVRPSVTARDRARAGLLRLSNAAVRWLLVRGHCRMALCEVHDFPRLPVVLRSGLRAMPLHVDVDLVVGAVGAADPQRTALAKLPTRDEFERILVGALPRNFPTLYLEGFAGARQHVLDRYPRYPHVIVSSVGWYYHEAFKFLAAEAAERGTRLVASQHGGGYGILRVNPHEVHEARLADRFIVWGWAEGTGPVHRNLPSPALSALLRRRPARPREGILFVANENFRYVYRLHSFPLGSQVDEWFDWQRRFLAALSPSLRAATTYREYPGDYDHGFGIRERITREFPEVRRQRGGRFEAAMFSSRLVVIDHCGTTLLQAMVAGVPTIAYWDPCRWESCDSAEPYLDALRYAGVLWDSPEAAAAKIAEVYGDVDAWWQASAVRDLRQRFAERFALARPDWCDHWLRALREEAVLAPGRVSWAG